MSYLSFLSTGDDSELGIYTLWDMLVIWYWVNKNSKSFGGESKREPLFCHSDGTALYFPKIQRIYVNYIIYHPLGAKNVLSAVFIVLRKWGLRLKLSYKSVFN